MATPEEYKVLGKIGISYKGEYASSVSYEKLDAVYHSGSTYLALKDAPAGAPNNDGVNWMLLAKGFPSDVGGSEIAFEEAADRTNIATGESIKTVFGRIKKWFADMTAAAFAQIITSNTDLMATTVSGYLVDALAVKQQFDDVNSKLSKLKYEIRMTYDSATTNEVGAAILTKPNDSARLVRAYTQNSNYFFRLYGDNAVQAVKYDNTIGVNMTFANARFLWLVPIE